MAKTSKEFGETREREQRMSLWNRFTQRRERSKNHEAECQKPVDK